MSDVLGVGLVGAGPVTQAIHLPTLARLPDRFRVAAVMDVDAELATAVARTAGAAMATSIEELLATSGVDVVAIGSPHAFHAEQVEAACAAGVRGILCEKPLATSRGELDRLSTVLAGADTALVVGAMHAYDPGWLAAVEACGDRFVEVHTVRSTIVLPFNDRFEDWASELRRGPAPERGTAPDPAARVSGLVLGLLVHDLPLVRTILPGLDQVDHVRALAPFGGVVSLSGGAGRCDLIALMRPVWRPDWRLEAVAEDWSLTVTFTPSYVHAGSASVEITRADGVRRLGPWPRNGYEAEWVELHAQVAGGVAPRYDLDHVVADMKFVADLEQLAVAS